MSTMADYFCLPLIAHYRKEPRLSTWLSIKQAAAHLACSREFLYRATREGRIKHGRVGSSLRFRVEDLDEFVLSLANSEDSL